MIIDDENSKIIKSKIGGEIMVYNELLYNFDKKTEGIKKNE